MRECKKIKILIYQIISDRTAIEITNFFSFSSCRSQRGVLVLNNYTERVHHHLLTGESVTTNLRNEYTLAHLDILPPIWIILSISWSRPGSDSLLY